ncbi:hypothetical protein Dimus_036154 [Dionaea muscipula]
MTSNSVVIKHGLCVSDNNRDTDCHSDSDEKNTDELGEDVGLPLEKLNLGPKKKLIVLGCRGFLFDRAHCYLDKIPSNRKHDGRFRNYLIYKRPFCEEFMNFCLQRFEIGLWSSGKVLDPKKGLGVYLDGLAEAEDVQAYVKAHPYGQPAVGPEHEDWLYYSKIRRRIAFD